MNKKSRKEDIDFFEILQPEQELERRFLEDPAFIKGLYWGVPRYGHPEGEIYKHILEVLKNIDQLRIREAERQQLRIIAFVHDTFKYLEDKSQPRDWSKHHSVYARKFLEQYTSDHTLLTITELHDEAYHIWGIKHLYHRIVVGEERLDHLLDRLQDDLQLYYLFFKCDTRTGDKNQAPLKWFESTVPHIEIHEF